ncbi:MAG: glycosyltransferase family 4 protein [Gemmatimonadaceae bacterium]|nr:glycosyltransferase family 4 protein [Gemmatimonadaceae bacterium]
MVSWRDPRHPRAGGAERYTAQLASSLVSSGMSVTWLAPTIAGAPATEVSDGVRIVRIGRGVGHIAASAIYLRRHEQTIDLVIDQANGYPMFTQFAYRGRRLFLIHQLASEIWFQHGPWLLAGVASFLEPWMLRLYRNTTTITVSRSTKEDLERLRFRDVRIVPNAVVAGVARVRSVDGPPHFVAIGRFVPSKRLEHVLRAFETVRSEIAEARLTVIGGGTGPYADALAASVARTPGARLERGASEERKWDVLADATALVVTSSREGWGIVVSEAHAVGTPSVAYNVPGLRDSTRHGVNGLICRPTAADAARSMLRLARDAALWWRLHEGALESARQQTPGRQRIAALAVVAEALARRRGT